MTSLFTGPGWLPPPGWLCRNCDCDTRFQYLYSMPLQQVVLVMRMVDQSATTPRFRGWLSQQRPWLADNPVKHTKADTTH
jgi:hypothetical protein